METSSVKLMHGICWMEKQISKIDSNFLNLYALFQVPIEILGVRLNLPIKKSDLLTISIHIDISEGKSV